MNQYTIETITTALEGLDAGALLAGALAGQPMYTFPELACRVAELDAPVSVTQGLAEGLGVSDEERDAAIERLRVEAARAHTRAERLTASRPGRLRLVK